jgi:hypothetical protein
VFSNAVITAAYFTIPLALLYLVRKRDDLKVNDPPMNWRVVHVTSEEGAGAEVRVYLPSA